MIPVSSSETAKPTPMKKSCPDGLASAVTMPTTCPARLSSGPPLLPGLIAASVWISPVSVGPASVPIPRPVAGQ